MSIYPRERISDALQDSANRGIAMLIAAAGFGKSEAARDAFGDKAHWVFIPEDGASPETIARLLIEKVVPRALRALNAHLARPQTDENRAHLAAWCASRLRTVEQPIVLEDFQRVCGEAASLGFVRNVIEATVPDVRWVIISRETPEIPIGTWLARDYMTLPVSADDLAFDMADARGVATALRVEIDDKSLAELLSDVVGWPLALRLSLGAWQRTQALPPVKIRTRHVLFEFIEKQVWLNLSDPDRRFLEAGAFLTELRPRILGAAGFAEPRSTLERLQLQLPLVSRVGNSAFRIHELFREFILERCTADNVGSSALVARLAQALERYGDLDNALAMQMRAENWDSAIALLARHGIDRIENGHRPEVLAALAKFPRALINHPVITGLRGFALAADGAYEVADRELQQALAGELTNTLRGELSIQRAAIALTLLRPDDAIPILRSIMIDERMEPDLRLRAAGALATASAMAGKEVDARDAIGFCAGSSNTASVEVRANIIHSLAYAHLCLGEPHLAESLATESVQLAHSIGLESLAARSYGVLQAVATTIYPDTVLARKYADACVRVAAAAGDRPMQIFGYQAQMMVAAFQGNDDEYDEAERGLINLGAERSARHVMWMRFFKVVREVGRGNIALATSAVLNVDQQRLTAPERALADSLLGLLLVSSKRSEAIEILERPVLVPAQKDFDGRRFLAYAQAYRALGQWLLGRGRAARRSPMPDLSMVTPRDAALLTVIMTICSTSRQTTTSRQLSQLTEPLLALHLDGHARFLRNILEPATIAQLTRTELEVLRELKVGGRTVDVADRLGKSSHTVLSHLKSACAKIGCSGRAAAVAYAEEMGWLN